MQKGTEVVYHGGGVWGDEQPFPNRDGFWQATFSDLFQSDRRTDGTPLEVGKFVLNLQIKIGDEVPVELALRVEIAKNRPH